MKILIIEDDLSFQEILRKTLEKERYIVEVAPDYRTGLTKLSDYTYDCILLDINLPDGNGLNLLRELKEMKKTGSLIIISARDTIEDKVEGLDLGADDYLPSHSTWPNCSRASRAYSAAAIRVASNLSAMAM